MARKATLAVVTDHPPEDAQPERRPTVKDAAAGTRRDLLAALRDQIAGEIDRGVPARDLASLSRRLLEIARDLEAMDAAENGDDVGAAAGTPDEPWRAE